MNKYIIYFLILIPIQNSSFNIGKLHGCQSKTFRNSRPFFLSQIDFSPFCSKLRRCLKKNRRYKKKCLKYFFNQMNNYCSNLSSLKRRQCIKLSLQNKQIMFSNSKNYKKNSSSSSSSNSKKTHSSSYQCKKEIFYIKLLKKKLKNIKLEECPSNETCAPVDNICDEQSKTCTTSPICKTTETCNNPTQFCMPTQFCIDPPTNPTLCDLDDNQCAIEEQICDMTENDCVDNDKICDMGEECLSSEPMCDDGEECLDGGVVCGDEDTCVGEDVAECVKRVRIKFSGGNNDGCLAVASTGDGNCDSDSGVYNLEMVGTGFQIVLEGTSSCLETNGGNGDPAVLRSCQDGNVDQVFQIVDDSPDFLIRNANGQFLNKSGPNIVFRDNNANTRKILFLNTCIEVRSGIIGIPS